VEAGSSGPEPAKHKVCESKRTHHAFLALRACSTAAAATTAATAETTASASAAAAAKTTSAAASKTTTAAATAKPTATPTAKAATPTAATATARRAVTPAGALACVVDAYGPAIEGRPCQLDSRARASQVSELDVAESARLARLTVRRDAHRDDLAALFEDGAEAVLVRIKRQVANKDGCRRLRVGRAARTATARPRGPRKLDADEAAADIGAVEGEGGLCLLDGRERDACDAAAAATVLKRGHVQNSDRAALAEQLADGLLVGVEGEALDKHLRRLGGVSRHKRRRSSGRRGRRRVLLALALATGNGNGGLGGGLLLLLLVILVRVLRRVVVRLCLRQKREKEERMAERMLKADLRVQCK
jgi:hypothetical protein